MQSIFATELFAGRQKRVNPRVVAVFHEQMRPFLIHVTIDRTADYSRTVWQVFGDNFQTLVGASLHAQGVTRGWFVLFV